MEVINTNPNGKDSSGAYWHNQLGSAISPFRINYFKFINRERIISKKIVAFKMEGTKKSRTIVVGMAIKKKI